MEFETTDVCQWGRAFDPETSLPWDQDDADDFARVLASVPPMEDRIWIN